MGPQEVVSECRRELAARRALFYQGIARASHGVLSGQPPAGAFYAFLKIDPAWKSPMPHAPASPSWASEQSSWIKRGRIGCIPGVDFGSVGENHVRFCFARGREELTGALASMEEALSS